MPRRLALSALAALLVASIPAATASAQVGPAGSTVGLPASPFASNYPSAPPPALAVRESGRRGIRRRVERAPDSTPLPPGRIPR